MPARRLGPGAPPFLPLLLANRPLLRPVDWVYTAIINVMELPATQVPLGFDQEGLPVGVQVVAGHAQDHLTIAVAMKLEKIFGGWVAPRPFHGLRDRDPDRP